MTCGQQTGMRAIILILSLSLFEIIALPVVVVVVVRFLYEFVLTK